MDRTELVELLRRERVPDALYDIPGVHDIQIQPDAYYFLRREVDGWAVGVRERSRDDVLARFGTEDEACRDLHTRLGELPSPAPDAAERVEQVFARREEIQRQAWQAYERASPDRASPPRRAPGPDGTSPPR